MYFLLKTFLRVVNPVVRRLLRSRFHWLLSGSVVLLEVTGRRSGRIYLTPVSYVSSGDALAALTYRHRQWWKNIRGVDELPVYLRGKRLAAKPEIVLDDLGAIATALKNRSLIRKFVAPAKPEETVMIRLKL